MKKDLGKIYVAGHRGMVGSAIVRKIEAEQESSWVGASRSELDLSNKQDVIAYVGDVKPDTVVIAAAKVGGIMANSEFPVDFLSENLQIELNLINAAHVHGIKNLIFLGSSCIYPRLSQQPIKEEYLLTGPLEPTNEPYALAKIAGVKLIQAYRKQYGYSWISVMPTNLYGPYDNFDLNSSHVLPAMISKFHLAKINNAKTVTLWGTGSPMREFLHADDLASACIFLLKNYDDEIAINVGTGKDVSISELAKIVKSSIGFNGQIIWDTTKPDGTPRKLLDVSRLSGLGWKSTIELESGIVDTYKWFLKNKS